MTDSTSTLYWSRDPGKFVNKHTGVCPWPTDSKAIFGGPRFEGSVQEWYETFVETLVDASNTIFKRNLQAAQIVEVNLDLYTILLHTVLFRPIKEGELPTIPQPEWLEGTVKGRLYNFTIVVNEKIPNNEARVKLISGFKASYAKPVTSLETIQIGEHVVSAPVVPEINLEPLPGGTQVLDQITVHVLDMDLL